MATKKISDTPDYLINQSSHTCLTVLSGNGPNDTVIGMAKCSGSVKQQWFFIHGKLLWGGNRSLCLAQNEMTNGLCLRPCDKTNQNCFHDQESRLILNSQALDVPWASPRTKVILYPKHDDKNQKWWTMSQLKTCLEQSSLQSDMSRLHVGQSHDVPDFMISPEKGELADKAQISAELLISKSTLTCLAVLKGTDPSNATIGLSPFTGDSNQQWFVVGGSWYWGGNQSYCLGPNIKNGSLCLVDTNRVKISWKLDKDGILETKGQVLDVPWEKPRTRVILYPKHGGENQRWWRLSDVRSALQKSAASESDFPTSLIEMTKLSSQITTNFGYHRNETETLRNASFSGGPKFLMNQSTHSCLSILTGTNPSDAVIGLAPFTGDVKQQWFVKDGHWEWGNNRSFCLAPKQENGKLGLTSSKNAANTWDFDHEGLLVNGSYALDVPWEGDRTQVILYPKHGGVNQKWWAQSRGKGPELYPFPASNEDLYQQEVARGIVNTLCPISEALPYPRDVTHYPGTVAPGTPKSNLSCILNVGTVYQAKNLCMTVPEDWQATNIYVVAGDIFKVILPKTLTEKQSEQITIRVGAHCDCLDPTSPNLKNKVFKRMPIISEEFEVTPGINTIRSQYGGNLIFAYEGKQNFQVKAEIHNAVEAPYYILGKTSSSEWKRMKTLAAPFSVLETDKVVLIVPTTEAKGISDIDCLLQRYDCIIKNLEDLSGFTTNDPPPQGKQWLVDDVQITAGSAHAGFPAMFDHQYYDLTSPETPYDWVVWHELGHNYQQWEYWSYAYGSESTVNLFSLYIEENLKADDRLKREKRYLKTAELVENGLTFQKADCWQKLVFLMEIKHAFPNYGWDMFRHLNRSTRALCEDEASDLSSSQQNQYDYVYKTLSQFIGTDLLPHYERWALPVSKEAKREVRALQLPEASRNLSAKAHQINAL